VTELETRPWLGNVRELRNFIERLTTLGAGEALAGTSSPDAAEPSSGSEPGRLLPAAWLDLPLREVRERCTIQMEREYLQALLERHGHNVSAAAQSAGVDRTYLHRLVRKYQI